MNRNEWIRHLSQWRLFLDKMISVTDDKYSKKKLTRQRKVIDQVRFSAVQCPKLLSEFINPGSSSNNECTNLRYIQNLNDSQKKAVSIALSDNLLTLIQGPPGTGKTQVIAEICLQHIKMNPNIRILICSETHIAVNNIIKRVSKITNQIKILRVKDRENDIELQKYSPESIVTAYISDLIREKCDSNTIKIIYDTIKSTNSIFIEKSLALSANIVGMTCNRSSAYTDAFNFADSSEYFDLAIIDEVCKATLPEILMPLVISKKAVLVGDPKQLPPVFCSDELDVIRGIEECELQKYMYVDELLANSENKILLDTQYRMNKQIGIFIGSVFYDGNLKNGRDSSDPDSIIWIDYKPTQSWPPYQDNAKYISVYNYDECVIIQKIINQLVSKVHPDTTDASVAIIAPYKKQIQNLRAAIDMNKYSPLKINIDTVDGFQGKECDIVIFSLTRTKGSFRFLADERRLNVALSRAKDKIIIVGNSDYAIKNRLLQKVLKASKVEKMSVEGSEKPTM